jgi:hypothetical protein
MNEAVALLIALLLAIVVAIASLTAFFSALGIYFPSWVHGTYQVAATSPVRSFVIGFVNLVFFGVIALAFFAGADSSGVQLLTLPALLITLLLVIALCLGLAGMVEQMGDRLSPATVGIRRTLLGTTVVGLACALPFVGWFLLLPYVGMVGMGAFIIFGIGTYRRRRVEGGEDSSLRSE